MTLDHGAPVEDVAWPPPGRSWCRWVGRMFACGTCLGAGNVLAPGAARNDRAATWRRTADPRRCWSTARSRRARGRAGARPRRSHDGLFGGTSRCASAADFSVPHSAKYGRFSPPALSPDANALAVGTANKLLSIRQRTSRARTLGGGGGDPDFTKSGHRVEESAAHRCGQLAVLHPRDERQGCGGILRCRGCKRRYRRTTTR